MSRRLLSGPSVPALETRAFESLAEATSGDPGSVLYLAPQDHPRAATRDRWERHGPSAALRVDTVAEFVDDHRERERYEGPATRIDRPLLFRLVELGVEGVASPANPFHAGDRFPGAGLVGAAESLYTDLEFAGLFAPAAMGRRLEAEGLPDRAAHVEELAEAVERARDAVLDGEVPETYRSERTHGVVTASTPLPETFPGVEAVVVGGFTGFDALERDLLDRVAGAWPTVALLPEQVPADAAAGVDAGVAPARATYRDLAFDREFHDDPPTGAVAARRRVVRRLFRHPDRSPAGDGPAGPDLDVTVHRPATVADELRALGRRVRADLAAGLDPGAVGVVLPDPVRYADRVRETLDAHGVPYALRTETPLPETALGAVVLGVCRLAREPRTADAVVALLANPLVAVPHGEGTLDHRELARVAARTGTPGLPSTLAHVDDALAATVESLLRDAAALADAPLDALPGRLGALLDRLGVPAALDGDRPLSAGLRARESRASDRLDRVLETLALTAPAADPAVGDAVDRLERAVRHVTVSVRDGRVEGSVVVCGLAESAPRRFQRVHVPGLTAAGFPSETDRDAFAAPIREAHPDFESGDVAAEARARFGALLAGGASLSLSVPRRDADGDSLVPAAVVAELRRRTDPAALAPDGPEPPPGRPEDVQRSVGEAVARAGPDAAGGFLDRAVEAGSLDADRRERVAAGVACAAARASPAITPYDGRLTPETVALVHGEAVREPYSPSRLETYAACGFKYFVRYVLGIDAPDPLSREPDAGARGGFVHDVLEGYYRSLQSAPGEPVAAGPGADGAFEARQRRLLDIALDRLDAAFGDGPRTAFQAEWLAGVLAGLGTPATNDHYAPAGVEVPGGDGGVPDGDPAGGDRPGRDGGAADDPPARGLLYRFLEHEFDEPAKTTARPTRFEARVGTPHDAGTPVGEGPARIDTPDGEVPVHGIVDRVDAVPGTDPARAVVRDYKTGTTPGEADTLLGLALQLPLYALAVEDALGVETVGGAYYRVSPPAAVSSRAGLVASRAVAAYHGSDDPGVPVLRHSYPFFETHGAFRRFLDGTTRRRLGALAGGVEAGLFHPTVLDPADAGCRYCDYADVCDVRPHRRHEAIDAIDDADLPAYVPPAARGLAPGDVLSTGGE